MDWVRTALVTCIQVLVDMLQRRSGLHMCEFGCLCGVMGTARLKEGEFDSVHGEQFPSASVPAPVMKTDL